MEMYEFSHHLTVEHEVWTVAVASTGGMRRIVFTSDTKYLQNSSMVRKIFIKFVKVMGKNVFV